MQSWVALLQKTNRLDNITIISCIYFAYLCCCLLPWLLLILWIWLIFCILASVCTCYWKFIFVIDVHLYFELELLCWSFTVWSGKHQTHDIPKGCYLAIFIICARSLRFLSWECTKDLHTFILRSKVDTTPCCKTTGWWKEKTQKH